jgi:hypothetical protein
MTIGEVRQLLSNAKSVRGNAPASKVRGAMGASERARPRAPIVEAAVARRSNEATNTGEV